MTTTLLDDRKSHYLDSYAFEKMAVDDAPQWIADEVKKGKSVGQWMDGFRVHGSEKKDIHEIESLWEAVTYFCQGQLDALVIDQNVYTIPQDARDLLKKDFQSDHLEAPQHEKLSPFALNVYGKYFFVLNKISEATACFSKALEKNSSFCEPYNNLGQLMWKVGKQRDAFVLFTESLAKNPHFLTAQLNFFEAGMELEEYASILNVIKYLEEEVPDCIEFQYYKAICTYHLGDHEKAKSILNRILELQPNDPEAKQLLENYA